MMNPIWGHLAGVFILLMMAAFIGIWIWAWLPQHERIFGWLARLPLEDDTPLPDETTPSHEEEQQR